MHTIHLFQCMVAWDGNVRRSSECCPTVQGRSPPAPTDLGISYQIVHKEAIAHIRGSFVSCSKLLYQCKRSFIWFCIHGGGKGLVT
jgi:hypothetical protein